MFKRIGNQNSSHYQPAPGPSIKDVTARAEGFIEEGMHAYAAGDSGTAGHAFQSARFHAHSLKKGEAILQAPRRGMTPAFAAIIHRDLTGLNAVLSTEGPHLCREGYWAIDFGHTDGLAAVGDRLNTANFPERDDHVRYLALHALRSNSPAMVSALWGAASEELQSSVLNPTLVGALAGHDKPAQTTDTETRRSLALAAFRATWPAGPSSPNAG